MLQSNKSLGGDWIFPFHPQVLLVSIQGWPNLSISPQLSISPHFAALAVVGPDDFAVESVFTLACILGAKLTLAWHQNYGESECTWTRIPTSSVLLWKELKIIPTILLEKVSCSVQLLVYLILVFRKKIAFTSNILSAVILIDFFWFTTIYHPVYVVNSCLLYLFVPCLPCVG